MSRIGYLPVAVPAGVKVNIADGLMTVEGPKGKLTQSYRDVVDFKIGPAQIDVTRRDETKPSKSFHGLYRQLLANMVKGVSEGFKITLAINGVGYKAELQDKLLVLSLGFSSDVYVGIPEGIQVAIEGNGQKLVLTGADRHAVGKLASEIRKLRAPEPYKGKGIRYEGEYVRKKVGKSGVK
ncbi:MAG: 50S ribosomal protein L6 [Spirochaetales bacterium]|nr:50S ribosomal protein L6 [Spirochaetales bacterium]